MSSRARQRQRTLAEQLAELQGGLCPICGQPLESEPLSVDHVWPRRGKQGRTGLHRNALATHHWCNNAKGDRRPTGCEIVWLAAINARLGFDPWEQLVAIEPPPTPTLADLWPGST